MSQLECLSMVLKLIFLNQMQRGLGEIIVKNKNCMNGYFGNNGKDQKISSADKWFHTGDAGYFNKAGHLVVIDRVTDLSFTSEKLKIFSSIS